MLSTPGDNLIFNNNKALLLTFISRPDLSLGFSCTPQATNSRQFLRKTSNTGCSIHGTPLVMDQVPGLTRVDRGLSLSRLDKTYEK